MNPSETERNARQNVYQSISKTANKRLEQAGMEYDSAIHNRVKSWFKGIDLTDREQVIKAWGEAHDFDRWWIGKVKVSDIHRKLREAKALTDEELAQISNWNGVVPLEALSAHVVTEPMGWVCIRKASPKREERFRQFGKAGQTQGQEVMNRSGGWGSRTAK